MIHFVTSPFNATTGHLAVWCRWGRAWRYRMRLLTYPELFRERRHQPGTYVLCDAELLSKADRTRAAEMRENLLQTGIAQRVLNNPATIPDRLTLLRSLHERHINPFNAWTIDARPPDDAFPVFLRIAAAHVGPGSPLLHNQSELEQAIAKVRATSRHPDGWIIVQYCDTADAQGVYRKYGAWIIEDRVIPTHLFHSSHWNSKQEVEPTPEELEAEFAYSRDNPHADAVREVCAPLGVTWGRVDYAIHDGGIVVWEINTNPLILRRKWEKQTIRLPLRDAFAKEFGEIVDRWSPPTQPTFSRRLGVAARLARVPLDTYRLVRYHQRHG